MVAPSKRGLPPLDLPLNVVSVILSLSAKLEFEYIRHGTQTLPAGYEVGTGKVIKAHVGDTRTEEDFANLVRDIINEDPSTTWIFVLDRLNTHMSEALVRLVAEATGIDCELGVKGRNGILKTMKSREEFLADPEHKIRFVYTPKHCSWLNQIEILFGILTRKALRKASFTSREQLRERIFGFVQYYNKTMANLDYSRTSSRKCEACSRSTSCRGLKHTSISMTGILVSPLEPPGQGVPQGGD